MLYVTTRVCQDAYTAARALSEDRGPAGGFYVPMRSLHFDEQAIASLGERPFSQNVAQVLNLLFGTNLDGWAVEFGIGRYPVKLVPLTGKITVAEIWHNPLWKFERLASGIEKAIRQSDQIGKQTADWLKIASRIAVLFGIYGQFLKNSTLSAGQKIDVAVPEDDCAALMAVWYARDWGLPVGTIVCCSHESNKIWNLLRRGEMRIDAASKDAIPADLERLICATLGPEETLRFVRICNTGGTYILQPEQTALLRKGIHVSVVSDKRMASTIPNLYNTTGFIADPDAALCYSSLIEYRAAGGESNQALIMNDESPLYSLQIVSECMNMTPAELKLLLA